MRRKLTVLANDYLSSVPGSGVPVKGGPARFSVELRQFLVAQGARWVGVAHETGATEATTRVAHREENFEIHFLGAPRATLEAIRESAPATVAGGRRWAAEDIAAAVRVIDETKPDVLFLNGYSAFAWVLLEAAKLRDVPVAIQHAGIFAIEVRQYSELFGDSGRRLCYAMERETARSAAANIFLNDFSRDAFTSVLRLKSPARGAEVIPLPHAGWDTCEKPFGAKPRENRAIGVVARWDRIKNLDAVLAFAEEVTRRKLPWKVRAVTKIPETPARSDFKARFRELIEVIAPMGRDELRNFYGQCDAMILPSHFDVSPTVVMEAAALGVPTLISPTVGWVSEYRGLGLDDWVADFSRPRGAVESLERQLARARWPELEKFADAVEERHDPTRVYRAYLDLFLRITG